MKKSIHTLVAIAAFGALALVARAQPAPKLLVVDDQPVNIQVLYRVFSADHQVLMAHSSGW